MILFFPTNLYIPAGSCSKSNVVIYSIFVLVDYTISPAQVSPLAVPCGGNGRDMDGGATSAQHAALPPPDYGSFQHFEGTLTA